MAFIKIKLKIPDWLDRIFVWPVLEYRKLKYGYPFRRIPLTDGKYAIVDPPDYYRFGSLDWCANEFSYGTYAVRLNNKGDKSPKILSLHRLIIDAPPGLLVDHQNGNPLDDRLANLRLATNAQNSCNRKKRKNTSSKYFGVSYINKFGKWRVKIKKNGKEFHIGYFSDEIEAAHAYDEAAKKYHGIFAKLNFPKENSA